MTAKCATLPPLALQLDHQFYENNKANYLEPIKMYRNKNLL